MSDTSIDDIDITSPEAAPDGDAGVDDGLPSDPPSEVASEPADDADEDPQAAIERELAKGKKAKEKADKPDPEAEYAKKAEQLTRGVAKREAQLVQEKAKLRETKAEVEQARAQAQEHIQRANVAINDANTAIKLAKDDPFAFLAKYAGLSPEDLARRVLNDGKPSVEEMVTRAQREAEEARREAQAIREQAAQREQQTLARQAERQFISSIREDEKLAAVSAALADDDELLEEAFSVGRALARKLKRNPSDSEIAAKLLSRYTTSGRTQVQSASVNEAAGRTANKGTENGDGSQGTRAEATVGPTLTNKVQAQRNSLGKDLLEMTPEEEREYVLSQITKRAS